MNPTVVDPPVIEITRVEPVYRPPIDIGVEKGTAEVKAEPRPLLFVAAQQDPRFARDFQPDYPPPEIRSGREGKVTVRVRIGTDGRVKEVQQVQATSAAFFEATRKQALAKWRFKPATRGGVPEESWRTMNLRFELTGA
ncbi:MAG: energy transducer TonB [Sphingomonas sp.]